MAPSKTIDALPDEVLVEIFSYVPNEELVVNVQRVCRRWSGLAHDVTLWTNYTFVPPHSSNSKEIAELLSKMPRLRSFTFHERLAFHPVAVALCASCKEVTKIACNVPQIDFEHLSLLAQSLTDLESLHIHPDALDNVSSRQVLCSFPNLSELKCTWIKEYYNVAETPESGTTFKALRCLDVVTIVSSPVIEKLIEANASNLLSLTVRGVHDGMLSSIGKCNKLEELKLDFLSRICDDFKKFLPLIGKLNHLRSLSLILFVHSSKDVLCTLFSDGNLASLMELDLSHCMNFSQHVAASIARCCPMLQVLKLKGCSSVDDSCMEQLAKCPKLQDLDISGCIRLTEQGLAHIACFRQLVTLNLGWLGVISGLMLEGITGSSSLRKLYVDHSEVSESDLIAAVHKIPSLMYLNVYRCADLDPVKLQQFLPTVRVTSHKSQGQ